MENMGKFADLGGKLMKDAFEAHEMKKRIQLQIVLFDFSHHRFYKTII